MRGSPDLPDYRLHSRQVTTISDRTERVIKDRSIEAEHIELVARFLSTHGHRDGPIVIKTSTADFRDRSHEPDHGLLESTLAVARDLFPRREIYLTDGPAFDANYRAIAESHGWIALAAKYGVAIRDLNSEMAVELVPGSVFVASLFRDAACTLSIGKAKTHRRTGISGAEKALIGYLSGDKMGYPKLEHRHYLLPTIYDAIGAAASPTLHIIDGANAIEGDGPMNGTPMVSDFLLLGEHAAALDIELSLLYQFDPSLIFSLLHPLDEPTGSVVPTTLLATQRSMASMAANPARPPRQQPWLYQSLGRRGSWRNRWGHNRLRKAYRSVFDG